MKFGFKFSNLCGPVYRKGRLTFTSDGNTLLSPVGNRVSVFDLKENRFDTLPMETSHDIRQIALSPNDEVLIVVDEEGQMLVINFRRRTLTTVHKFKSRVNAVTFAPDSKCFMVACEGFFCVVLTPSLIKEYAPLVIHKKYSVNTELLDSTWRLVKTKKRWFTAGKDGIIRYYDYWDGLVATLVGHRDYVLRLWWEESSRQLVSVSRDGQIRIWWEKNGVWSSKYITIRGMPIISLDYNADKKMLAVGRVQGLFQLYELSTYDKSVQLLCELTMSRNRISSCSINPSGEWLAFGVGRAGQLLVWEWKSETYILKQQSHSLEMSCVSYSGNGRFIATGGQDGKIKLWNTSTGFCFVTFTEHKGAITALTFSKNGNSIYSASTDGTVRAYDVGRYRNFRTFTGVDPVQFSSVAVDSSGEVVCAGGMDTFDVYVWSVQTGKLLDIMTGHEGPVSCVSFNPITGQLVSGSWDKTIKVWEVFKSRAAVETFNHSSEVLAVAYRPDGNQIAVATMDGNISFWDPKLSVNTGLIEGRKDLGKRLIVGTRLEQTNREANVGFTTLAYSADGTTIVAGGDSKYVCMYEVNHQTLLHKFQTTKNENIGGVETEKQFFNKMRKTEVGDKRMAVSIKDDLDEFSNDTPLNIIRSRLPGQKQGVDPGKRDITYQIKSLGIAFSPTGRSWCVITIEGLLIYSLDENVIFDPFQLDIDVTEGSIRQTLHRKNYLFSLVMALRLNEIHILKEVFVKIPAEEIQTLVRGFPSVYLSRFLSFLSKDLETSPLVEYHMMWLTHLFNVHGPYLKDRGMEMMSIFRNLQKSIGRLESDLSTVCEDNTYALAFLSQAKIEPEREKKEEEEDVEVEDGDAVFDTLQNIKEEPEEGEEKEEEKEEEVDEEEEGMKEEEEKEKEEKEVEIEVEEEEEKEEREEEEEEEERPRKVQKGKTAAKKAPQAPSVKPAKFQSSHKKTTAPTTKKVKSQPLKAKKRKMRE
ncbi:periodic tryptophan protein [Planoprotostelium fungivorum]|uniref:Periodic tryptophan protein n=1 Tax=Planoprotostelium fungivorum TaxID=1890364 RepID=A0A2P6NF53_9EUKA|nr:periodic tryptophan protein [Planoprotostelium fungivorum]